MAQCHDTEQNIVRTMMHVRLVNLGDVPKNVLSASGTSVGILAETGCIAGFGLWSDRSPQCGRS